VAKSVNLKTQKEDPRDPKGIGEKPLSPAPKTGFGVPFPVPPAAGKRPPGVTGTPPMAAGQTVSRNLTPRERRELEEAGVNTRGPLPRNMAQIMEQLRSEQAAAVDDSDLKPPVPLSTPPVTLKIEEPKTAAEKSRAEKLIEEAFRAEAESRQRLEIDAVREGMSPSVAAAHQVASEFPAEVEIENDVDEIEAEDAASDTGLESRKSCPHCNWPLHLPDPVEPEYGEKMAFLHSMLGHKPYRRTIHLLGGQLRVTFRTLMTRELDVCYEQLSKDVAKNKLMSQIDHMEQLSRYRLCLQLSRIETTEGVMIDLPEALNKEAVPNAQSVWEVDEGDDDDTALPQIESYIMTNVLATESLVRVLGSECGHFNRYVAKMEAMVNNPDFWQRTAEQS